MNTRKTNRLYEASIKKKNDPKPNPEPDYSPSNIKKRKTNIRKRGKDVNNVVDKKIYASDSLKKEKQENQVGAIHPSGSNDKNKLSSIGSRPHPRNPTPAPEKPYSPRRTKSFYNKETPNSLKSPNKSSASKYDFSQVSRVQNNNHPSTFSVEKNPSFKKENAKTNNRPKTSYLSPRDKKTTENHKPAKNPSTNRYKVVKISSSDQCKPAINDKKHFGAHQTQPQIPEKEITDKNENNKTEIEQTQQNSLKEVDDMNEFKEKKMNELISEMEDRFKDITEILKGDLFKCIYDEIPKNLLENDD